MKQIIRLNMFARKLRIVLLITLGLLSAPLRAHEAEEHFLSLDHDNRFYLGVGSAIVRFNTKIKYVDKQLQIPIVIDPEGSLDLPEVSNVYTLYGGFRFAKRHSLDLHYFSVDRETSVSTGDLNLGDIIVLRGDVRLSDKTHFLALDYGYNVFSDRRTFVDLLVGLYVLDLKYELEASGQIEIDGVVDTRTYKQVAEATAPVPNVGVRMNYALSPRWSTLAQFAFIAGSRDEIEVTAMKTDVTVKYLFTKHFGADFGVSYFNADLTIEDAQTRTDVNYGYNGIYVGLRGGF